MLLDMILEQTYVDEFEFFFLQPKREKKIEKKN